MSYTLPALEEVLCFAVRHRIPPIAVKRLPIHFGVLHPVRHQVRDWPAVTGNHNGLASLDSRQQAGKLRLSFADIEPHVSKVVQRGALWGRMASCPAKAYSYRSASTGSNRDARDAGYQPASRLTTSEKPIAPATSHQETYHTSTFAAPCRVR